MTEPDDPLETVEGMVWPIVLLVEGSMLRASQMVKEQKPHVVVAPSSLPVERTQVLRDATRELGIDLLLISANAEPQLVVEDVRAAVARISKTRPRR